MLNDAWTSCDADEETNCVLSSTCGQSLTESVGVERQTLELQEVPDGSRKNFDLIPRQIHGPQVTGESLQLLWKLKQHEHQEMSATEQKRLKAVRDV